jgi:1-acyl-sn-glycerol-3-phosphate acyltransferase
MFEAQSHKFLTPLVRSYLVSSVRGHFSDVRLRLEEPLEPLPTIFFATHQSWWDGHLILALCQHCKLEFRVMMLEENLQKYQFLRFAGAYGVGRSSLSGVRASLRYSLAQLETVTPSAVLLFPSGEIASPFVRPIPFESGLASLVSMCARAKLQVQVRPLAIRLEHGPDARPNALLRLGAPSQIDPALSLSNLNEVLRRDLTTQADLLHNDLLQNRLESYSTILKGLPSAQQGWDALRRSIGVRV